MRSAAPLATLALVAGCPHGDTPAPSGPLPTVAEVVDRLARARDELRSFRGAAVMEYWLGDDRFKGDVLAMAETGARVRLAALSPAGGATAAEMACDGQRFVSVNHQSNCALTGPCNKQSIAAFFGLELDPDDFLHLALGTPPVVEHATGTVAWDGANGIYRVQLTGDGGKQTIGIAPRGQAWDVVDSELIAPDGTPGWSVKNAAFGDVQDPAGKPHRVPGKSRFATPNRQRADLSVDWQDRTVNVTLEPEKFAIEVPPGLPTCQPPAGR